MKSRKQPAANAERRPGDLSRYLSYEFMTEWVLHGLSGGKLVLQAILPAKTEHQDSRIPQEADIGSQILDITHGSSLRADAS